MYKILDGNMKIELEEHDEQEQIIQPNQGGFKRQEGSNEHLFVIQNIFHYNQKVFCAFLDLRKAYDTVRRDALLIKLHKECKLPKTTTNFIQAMYKNTWSIIRANDKLSVKFQTHKGLAQGALSSPILFNFYINNLIKQLNNTGIGTTIGKKKISSLLFADDIYINATSQNDLAILLKICADWATDLDLKFSPSKSELLSNQKNKLEPVIFQNNTIKHAKKDQYKYLGIPIYKKGIHKTDYLKKQTANFFIKRNIMKQFCKDYGLSNHHRVIIYKSVIRSQFDYGTHIINYTKEEIKKFENYQHLVLKNLLDINKDIDYHTLLYILDIPTINCRIQTIKSNFFFKLKNNSDPRSMAKQVFDELYNNHIIPFGNMDTITPIAEYKNILLQNKVKPVYYNNNDMNLAEARTFIQKILYENNLETTRKEIEHAQYYRKYKHEDAAHKPLTPTTIAPLLHKLRNKENCQLITDKNYIQNKHHNYRTRIINSLGECDNNAAWYSPKQNCKHCTRINIQRPALHNLLTCIHFKKQRKAVLNSLQTEIDNLYHRQYDKNEPLTDGEKLSNKDQNLIQYAKTTQLTDFHKAELMHILLGNTIHPQNKYRNQITRILNSHLILLADATQKHTPIKTDFQQINNSSTLYHKNDLREGKIVVRTIQSNQLIYQNIRPLIEDMSMPDLQKYNIGLGAASSRTDKQKQMAQLYTQKVLDSINSTIITSDASINQSTKKGGIGILAFTTSGQNIYQTSERVDTDDAQYGEIYGIRRILQLIVSNDIPIQKQVAILCDCKNAIKIITNYSKCPSTYKILIQDIKELLYTLNTTTNITANFHWIPGHTGNKYNDIVDTLAKEAANSWPQNSHTQQLLSSQEQDRLGQLPLRG